MRSNTFVTFVLLATVAGSSMAAPAPIAAPVVEDREFTDLEARGGAGSLLASAGKGLLTGAGLTALTTFLQNEFGGSSSKREFTNEQLAVLKALAGSQQDASVLAARAGVGSIIASAGKGLLTGAGLTALTDFLQNELGGGSQSQKRALADLEARGGAGSLLASAGKGLLTGAGLTALTDFLQNEFGGSQSQKRELSELEARAGVGSLLASAGKGLLTGAGITALTDFVENEFGSGSQSQKRELSELEARAGVGSLLASAGKGLLTGAGITALTDFVENEFGGSSSSSSKRDPLTTAQLAALLAVAQSNNQARGLGTLLVDGGEDLASILGKGIASGVGSGVGSSIIGGIFGNSGQQSSKREIDERGIGTLLVDGGEDLASILGKGIASGVGSGVGSSIIGGIFGNSGQQSSKREVDERGIGTLLVDGGEDLASILGKGIASGVGSGVGSSIIGGIFGNSGQQGSSKREIDERGLGTLLVDGGEDLASILGKGIAGGVGSGVGSSIIDGVFGNSGQQSSKREIDERGIGTLLVDGGEDLASILGKGVASGVGSGVGSSVIDGIFGNGNDNSKREPVNPLVGLLAGQAASFGTSQLVQDSVQKLEDILKREPVNPVVGTLLGQGISFGTSQLVQDGIDKLEQIFKREPVNPVVGTVLGQGISFGTSQLVQDGIQKLEDILKREPEPVNPLVGLLAGQAASFGTSQLVQEGIDKVESLFKGRELGLNDLD